MNEVPDYLPEALEFHKLVTDRAAAHLNLLSDSTYRTTWLAAKLLSRSPETAQHAAKSLAGHLASTRPGNRSLFEEHLPLWGNLVAFSEIGLAAFSSSCAMFRIGSLTSS